MYAYYLVCIDKYTFSLKNIYLYYSLVYRITIFSLIHNYLYYFRNSNIKIVMGSDLIGDFLLPPSPFTSGVWRSAGLLFFGVWLHLFHSFSDVSFQLIIGGDNRNLLSFQDWREVGFSAIFWSKRLGVPSSQPLKAYKGHPFQRHES